MTDIVLPPPSPRDCAVQAALLPLIEGYCWAEAAAILQARLAEISRDRQTHLDRVFMTWAEMPASERPDFLTFAHHRRNPQVTHD